MNLLLHVLEVTGYLYLRSELHFVHMQEDSSQKPRLRVIKDSLHKNEVSIVIIVFSMIWHTDLRQKKKIVE